MKPNRFLSRRWIVVVLVLFIFILYVARLINVQIVQAEDIRGSLEAGVAKTQTVKAFRGEIVDRNGVSLVSNELGYDVIIDMVSFPRSIRNEVILRLIELFEKYGAGWNDTLPITAGEPFAFQEGYDSEINYLKNYLEIASYATVDDTLYHLTERYGLADYSPGQARKIAGVRYNMELRGFAVNVLYTFATDIDIDLVLQIKEQSYLLPGVDIQESAIRYYDRGATAPHLIGTVGPIYPEELEELQEKGYARDDIVGKSGAERAFEEDLRGQNGERVILLDGGNQVIGVEEKVPPEPGKTIYLTIDADLQDHALKALEAQIKNLQQTAAPGKGREADYGAVAVVRPKTGEILACTTYPSYDLGTYYSDYASLVAEDSGRPLLNRAIQGLYAPGSVFKPVVGTAGLSTGVINEQSTVLCNRIYSRFTNHRFTCMSAHGNINLTRALSLSCNIFFYDVGWNVGIDKVDLTAKQYGLGEPTGIELYEEWTGQRSNPETYEAIWGEAWTPGNVVQSSIGQLVAQFTPLQMANYAATIANRGERMKLTIVKEKRDYAREEILEPLEPVVADRVDARTEHFEAIIRGMVTASRSGTAAAYFAGYPYDVASKTGTPEANMLNSTFICFAPAEDPEIAIAVVIENGYHGYTSAPVAREIMNYYFGFENANPLVPRETPADLPGEADRVEAASGQARNPEDGANGTAQSEPSDAQSGEEESVNNG